MYGALKMVRDQHVIFSNLNTNALPAILLPRFLDSNDVEVFSREEIERAHVRFYSDLFPKDPIDAVCKQIYLSSIDKFLSPPQRDTCEGLLSLPELTDSLRCLNSGRSPGSNGLTTEFYLHFWNSLGPLYYVLLSNVF